MPDQSIFKLAQHGQGKNEVYGGNAMGKGTVKFCLELETDSRPSEQCKQSAKYYCMLQMDSGCLSIWRSKMTAGIKKSGVEIC